MSLKCGIGIHGSSEWDLAPVPFLQRDLERPRIKRILIGRPQDRTSPKPQGYMFPLLNVFWGKGAVPGTSAGSVCDAELRGVARIRHAMREVAGTRSELKGPLQKNEKCSARLRRCANMPGASKLDVSLWYRRGCNPGASRPAA